MYLEEARERFQRSLITAGRSAKTARSYGYLLAQWGRWLEGENMSWSTVTEGDALDFLDEYGSGHSRTSNALMLTCLRSFYRWAGRRGHVQISPVGNIEPIVRDRPLPRGLPRWQVRELLERMNAQPATLDADATTEWARNRVIVLAYLFTGARLSEIATLRWEKIDMLEGIARVLGKGRKERDIPLHPLLLAELRNWGPQAAGPLFLSRRGGALSAEGISEMFRRWVVGELGVNCTAHQLRHTIATELRRRKVDLRVIQRLLGHANLNTTAIYTAVYDEDIREGLNQLADDWNAAQ